MRGCRNGLQAHREAADAIAGPVPRPSERPDLAVNARLTREREPGPRATRLLLAAIRTLRWRVRPLGPGSRCARPGHARATVARLLALRQSRGGSISRTAVHLTAAHAGLLAGKTPERHAREYS